MELKPYQQAALDRLEAFLSRARMTGAGEAYARVTADDDGLRRYISPYRTMPGLPDVPYCCLRLPTGGGKTLLASHAIKVASAYVERERPLVLWLAPSKTIAEQTVAALKNPAHPYRMALDAAFAGRVRVLEVSERRQVLPHDLAESLVIFIGTYQSFNVTNEEGRKVYSHDENFEPHFRGAVLPEGLAKIESGKGAGQVAFSFANLLKWHRPVLILDEAHNFVTGLAAEVKQRLNPKCVIEFTATPEKSSNTIFNATARALRDAEMIKLPINFTTHKSWEGAVAGALAERAALAKCAAADTGRYIRPITLFQAQPDTGADAITVEKLKAHLIANNVPADTIAVATGDVRELDGINLLDPKSRINHVITVQALKEGWDCSFAYVFCSLANIGAEGAVEQLLGRVLRQPYAERRQDPALNQAYAHVSSLAFSATAQKLKDQLVKMGFDAPGEAAELIVQHSAELEGGGINRDPEPLAVELDVPIKAEDLPAQVRDVVTVAAKPGGGCTVHLKAEATEPQAKLIAAVIAKAASGAATKAAAATILDWQAVNDARRAPAGRGETFAPIPLLQVRVQGELELAQPDIYIDLAGWRLADVPADVPAFDFDPGSQTFRFDLDGEKLSYSIDASGPTLALDYAADWDERSFTSWLTQAIDQREKWHSTHSDLLEFNRRAVSGLLAKGHTLSLLVQARYVLKRKIEEVIRTSRHAAAKRGQEQLFGQPEDVVVAADFAFSFDPRVNPATRFDESGWSPRWHFYPRVGHVNGEELECAQALDAMPEVKFWVRNGDRGTHCFSLPTSSDRFHPDFVAELKDGTVFVVEYKGADRFHNPEEQEKAQVGAHWARRSNGRCRFVMASKMPGLPSVAQQLRDALGA
jgi:type III restriction enzyme